MKRFVLAVCAASIAAAHLTAQHSDWTAFGGDAGGTKYSTLTQINTKTVKDLKRAWTFHTGDKSGFFESTPLVIDSVLYFSAQNGVYALDAVTGQQIWKYATSATTRRGLTYWPGDKTHAPRLYSSTADGLAALDVKTGAVIPTFGEKGFLPNVWVSSAGSIYKNLLITQGGNGTVKAWDLLTGELKWTLHLKAQPGDPNQATWLKESWKLPYTPGLWGMFTVDVGRGLVFVPVEKVGNDYYGGPHPGNNLYSNSLLAVDANSGAIKWFQQLTHHDIWDYDPAAEPTLVDVRRGGRTIPGVALITKMGVLFVFNRETGEPMYGMEERPVPQTTVKDEWTSPTQPFPLKPAPLARNSLKKAELDALAKISPELEAHCKGLWEKYNLADAVPYDPWREKQDIVVFPGAIGGGNWNGVMFHKPLGLMITNVMNAGQWGHLEEGGGRRGGRRGAPAGEGAGRGRAGAPPDDDERQAAAAASGVRQMSKVTPEGGRFWDAAHMYSCAPPPWGELIAVNANTGDIAWRVPLGEFPELAAKGIKTGQPMLGGGIATAGNLIFIGATVDGYFRALDARNGQELWREKLAAPAHSIPSTYMGRDGRQYVVVPAGGGGFLRSPTGDEVVAFALPNGR
jgi:glucose dehydrogenase